MPRKTVFILKFDPVARFHAETAQEMPKYHAQQDAFRKAINEGIRQNSHMNGFPRLIADRIAENLSGLWLLREKTGKTMHVITQSKEEIPVTPENIPEIMRRCKDPGEFTMLMHDLSIHLQKYYQ